MLQICLALVLEILSTKNKSTIEVDISDEMSRDDGGNKSIVNSDDVRSGISIFIPPGKILDSTTSRSRR